MNNLTICKAFIDKAQSAINDWDGVSTAELILSILLRTGDNVRETLQEADYKWRHNLYPPEEKQ